MDGTASLPGRVALVTSSASGPGHATVLVDRHADAFDVPVDVAGTVQTLLPPRRLEQRLEPRIVPRLEPNFPR